MDANLGISWQGCWYPDNLAQDGHIGVYLPDINLKKHVDEKKRTKIMHINHLE